MKKILQLILFLALVNDLHAQLNITVTDTTVCNSNSFQVCASSPVSVLSGITLDDNFSSVINIGFTFKFMGTNYTQCVISDNNLISFNTTLAGGLSNYDYNTALANGQLNNVIMFPFQDLYVAGNTTGVIRYMTMGTAPYRKFIVEFCNVAYYNCTSLTTTNQLIIYETTNEIEMHIQQKQICSTWPNGAQGKGVQGIRGTSASSEYFVTGRGPSDPTWSVSSPEAKKFSPTNAAATTYSISSITYSAVPFFTNNTGTYSWYKNNNATPFASTNCVNITPSPTDQYYVVKYTGTVGCLSTTTQVLYDTMFINYTIPTVSKTLNYCSSQLPVTWNGVTIPVGTTSQNNYDTVLVSSPNSCDTNFIINLNISTPITPTFAQVGPYCSQTSINPLLNTSQEGITGTWSPAFNNSSTTTYTFTPTTGQCANTATMTVTINPSYTPTFTQVPAICVGGTFTLPTTSLNGYTGTWSPAINNQVTTTYTFTPSGGSCINNASMTVVVNPPVTPTFTQLMAICIGDTFSLPSTSNNGISGTWSPALNNQATTTYTFTPNAGSCATTTTMTVYVNNNTTPTFTQVPPQCAGTTFSLPTVSNNMTTGTWSPAINTNATTTYTFTPDTGQCATPATMTVNITPQSAPTFNPIGPICSGQGLSFPATSLNGISGTWSPASNNTVTTTYYFTPNAGQCASIANLTVTVLPTTTPTFNQVGPVCVGSTFTLPNTSLNGINGSWSPAINNTSTTTYTFTPSSTANCTGNTTMTVVINPGTLPTFTQINPICVGGTFTLPTTSNNGITGTWSPSINNTATTTYTFTPNGGQCAVPTTMTVNVGSNLVPNFPATDTLCQNVPYTLPTTSPNGITGTWSPAFNGTTTTTYYFTPNASQCAVADTMQIIITPNVVPTFTQIAPICVGGSFTLPLISNNGIQGTWLPAINNTATTTYTFTPKAGTCATTTTMTVQVLPIVTPTFTQVAAVCAGASITLPNTSNNGIPGSWSPAINNMATTTYTFTPSAGQCATNTTMTITVNPILNPTFAQVAAICAGGSFTLPTTSTNGISGTWSPAINNMSTTTYTFTPNAGQCATTTTMTVTVNPIVIPTFTQVLPICQGDLLPALPTTSNNGINGNWTPAPNNNATTTYTFTPTSGICVVPTTMTITVKPKTYGNHVVQICDGEAYFFNGNTYTTSNYSASDTFVNAMGCDSIVTLNLTVVPVNPYVLQDALTGCGSVTFNGQTYTSSTILYDTLYTTIGCDSVYRKTSITVHPQYNNSIVIDTFACKQLLYDGVLYTQSYHLNDTLRTIYGCDSVIRDVNITIDTFNLSATVTPFNPYLNENVKISAISNLGSNYQILSWSPSSDFPNQQDTVQQFKASKDMYVVITGSSANGCIDTAYVSFKVRSYIKDVEMPNAFSPNGDGRNDVFKPILAIDRSFNLVEFRVYNRYGQAVFATSSVNKGWDGTHNGKVVDQGVYYYTVTIVFMDGTRKTFKGDVTVIK